tara:strand:- start:232 stop:474 length:243 start_codon:yes stop_codon:yes gene_type:complete
MDDDEKVSEPSEEDIPEKCFCGNDRSHYMVTAIPTYTSWGHFWVVLMGVSAIPIRIDFQCRVCKEKFDFTTQQTELKQFL